MGYCEELELALGVKRNDGEFIPGGSVKKSERMAVACGGRAFGS